MKKILISLMGLLSLCGGGVAFADTTVQWVNGATVLSEGVVTVDYDGDGQVTNLHARTSGGGVTLAGAEAIPFAADAELWVDAGTLRVETPVVGAGNLRIRTTEGGCAYDLSGSRTVLPEAEADAVVIAHDAVLDRLRVDHAYYDKGNIPEVCISDRSIGMPFHEVRGDGTYVCQLQVIDGGWTKCVFLHLKQEGRDIVAWTPKARYDAISTYGKDFSASPGNPFNLWQPGETEAGYALDVVRLVPVEVVQSSVVFTRRADVAGTLRVDLDVDVVAEGEATFTEDLEWNHNIQADGSFTIRNPAIRRISGQFTFGSFGSVSVVADAAHDEMPTELRLEKDLPGSDWLVVAQGVSILAVTNVTAEIGRGGWFGAKGQKLGTYHFTRSQDGLQISCQFQYYDNATYVKGVAYELRQVGGDIEARVAKAGYWTSTAGGADVGTRDITRQNNMAIDTGSNDGYGIGNIRLHFDDTPYQRYVELAATAVNGTSGKMELCGSANERLFVRGLNPKAMEVSIGVWTNTVCLYNPTNSSLEHSFGGGKTYSVHTGGEFWQRVDWVFNLNTALSIDGGVLRVGTDKTGALDTIAPLYIESVTFVDGGHLAGHPPRTGYYANPKWTVIGSHPAFIDHGLGIVGHDKDVRTITFAVEDVTGDDRPDLYIGGKLYYSNSEWVNAKLVKTGPGTVSHAAANTVTSFPLLVQGGFWKLAATGGMTMNNAVTLDGGGLALADGCTNAVGRLTVMAGRDAELRIGADAELDLGSLDLGDGARLDVTLPRPSRLRVGTTRCLTHAQLRAIRVNGEAVHQRGDGYVREGPGGIVVYIR